MEKEFQDKVKKAFELVYSLEPERMRWFSPLPKGKEIYWTHLYSVFKLCFYWEYPNEDLLIASILHDVLEDTNYTKEQMRADFGEKVTDIVILCTKKEGYDPLKQEDQNEYFENIFNCTDMAVRKAAMSIKLADRLDNLMGASFIDKSDVLKRYYDETKVWYVKIAKDLGKESYLDKELRYVEMLI